MPTRTLRRFVGSGKRLFMIFLPQRDGARVWR
jgi:hypothetical protein